jgi:diguanylate cyclase (GGDEF)-like protein
MHDNLTGLPNRYLLADRMRQQVADAMHRNTSVALFIVDLDNFKRINDTYGHTTGDKLLVEFSKLILQHTREADTVARVGGDEFVLVCPCARGGEVEFINDLAGRMFATLTSTKIQLIEELSINVKMSVGVSFYPEHATDPTELLNHADEALYVVKEQGKNHYEIWTPHCTHFATLRKQNGVQVSRI